MIGKLRRAIDARRPRAGMLLALAILLFACREITRPLDHNVGGKPAYSINPPGSTDVTPGNMHGWIFYDDQHDSTCTVTTVCAMVTGPATPPRGSGSAELATASTSDGKALLLADYGGTRLDQITELQYSTYRQTTDPGHNLAISLQLNVDYDLTDASTGYQGRIVFEPYQGVGGNVPDTTWQTWDAKAGLWWGTKSSVTKGGVTVTNPCVQATPCTWSAMLAAFPDIGIHTVYGAVVFKAGSGWPAFRGNVDNFTIGIGGSNTTFGFELNAAKVHLHTEIAPTASGTHLPADSDYTPGAVITYSLAPAAGDSGLLVVLDDTLAAASATIVMNQSHTILVTAEPIITPNAQVQAWQTSVPAMLKAADPAAAYSDFLQSYLDRSGAIGSDSAEAELSLATYLSIDPIRDGATMSTFDNAMAGNVFVIDYYNGQLYDYYYTPSDYASIAASRVPVAPGKIAALRRTGSHRVPAAVLNRMPSTGKARRLDVVQAPTGPPWSNEFTEILYVNGIFTPEGSHLDHTGAAGTMDRLSRLVYQMPRFQTVAGNNSPNVEVNYFWNRNLAGQLAEFDQAHQCIGNYFRGWGIVSMLRATYNYSRCKGLNFVYSAVNNDIVESGIQFLQLETHIGAPLSADAGHLADLIAMYHGPDYGYHEIFVTHSQGNLLFAQGIQLSPAKEGRPLQTGYCTADLALASPIGRSTFGIDQNYLRGFIINGDVMTVLGLPNDFAHINTPLSDSAARLVAAIPPEQNANVLYQRLAWGSKLHGVDSSYIVPPSPSRDSITSMLSQLDDECTTGSIQATPSSLTLPLGSSTKLTLNVISRAGQPLLGRLVNGGGLYANIDPDDSTITAIGPGGPEIESLMIRGNNQTFGTLTVTVPPVSFPGKIVEHLSSVWQSVGGSMDYSDPNNPPTVPPAPAGSPPWSGLPSDCSATTTTTGNKSYTNWQQICGRTYTLEIPADPLPVQTAVRVLYADYPSGAFSNNPWGGYLTPHVAVSEALPYSCGPEYCLRAAVLQTRNSFQQLMTSDTSCFSDQCSGSFNRAPVHPGVLSPVRLPSSNMSVRQDTSRPRGTDSTLIRTGRGAARPRE